MCIDLEHDVKKQITEYIRTINFNDNCFITPLIIDIEAICAGYCNKRCKRIIDDLINYLDQQGFNGCYDCRTKTIHAYIYNLSLLK